MIQASLPLPEVKRKAEILVRVQARIEGQPNPLPAGAARLFVYPKDLMKEVAATIGQPDGESGVQLMVFGKSERIRPFLEAHEIPFSDCGTELPAELNKRALYIGETDVGSLAPHQESAAGGRIMFFSSEPGILPGVYVSTNRGVSIMKVTLPILDTLATNPHSQQTFAGLLHQSLTPNPP